MALPTDGLVEGLETRGVRLPASFSILGQSQSFRYSRSVSVESDVSQRSVVSSGVRTDASPPSFNKVNVFTDAGLAFSILRADLGNYTAGRAVCHALADHIDHLNVPRGFDMENFVLVENPNAANMKILEQSMCLADFEFPQGAGDEQALYVKYLPDLNIMSSSTPSFDDYFKTLAELKKVREELDQTQRKVAVLDGQNLALYLTLYHGFHGGKTSKDSVKWDVGRDYMEELYFENRHMKKTLGANRKPKFSEDEWQRVKDHWIDTPTLTRTGGDPDDFGNFALDIMFHAIGVPVYVAYHNGGWIGEWDELHLRIPTDGQYGLTSMQDITLGQLRDLVWEKWGEAWLEDNGWRRHEMHFGHFICGCLQEYDRHDRFEFFEEEDDEVIGHYFNDGSALEMRLFPSYDITSEEETEENESEADAFLDAFLMGWLVCWTTLMLMTSAFSSKAETFTMT